MSKLILEGGHVVDPASERDGRADVLIQGGPLDLGRQCA